MDYRKQMIVKPGQMLRLKDVDPAFKGRHETREAAAPELERYRQKLIQLQGLLYAEKKHSVLIVLQAMDAGGKDGTIKHVFGALNPQGASVASFKQPTPIELDHDFLWRVHPHAPPKGWVAIFNRSHYEDVLIARVHKLVDKPTWTARYDRIRSFESGLRECGTSIIKFFLHISKEGSSRVLLNGLTIQRAIGKLVNPTMPSARFCTIIWRHTRMPSPRPARARRRGM
jgi:polyphosphate kinase 2 (PPK2 family)